MLLSKLFKLIVLILAFSLINFLYLINRDAFSFRNMDDEFSPLVRKKGLTCDKIYKLCERSSVNFLDSNGYFIAIGGFGNIEIKKIPSYFKFNFYKTSKSILVHIYGFTYGIESFKYAVNNNKKDLIVDLLKLTELTLNEVEAYRFMPNAMINNDHAISKRLEFLMFLKEYGRENGFLSVSLDKRIDNHICFCVKTLMDPKRFTWKTNHGLMQLRVILNFLDNYDVKNAIVLEKECNERIEHLLPYFFAKDGSVLEGASDYWLYIASIWEKYLATEHLSSKNRKAIFTALQKYNVFINDFKGSSIYFQGIGDAYSSFESLKATREDTCYYYAYENGLNGLNAINNEDTLSFHFVALDNRPNVHNLPEELGVYLFLNEPLFLNCGSFHYGKSKGRSIVKNPANQNNAFFDSKTIPDSAILDLPEYDKVSHQLLFSGTKWYGKDKIFRKISIDIRKLVVSIKDYSTRKVMHIGYNLNPKFKTITSGVKYLFIRDLDTISLTSNKLIERINTEISPSYNQLTTISRLEMIGDTITTCIQLPNHFKFSEELKGYIGTDKKYYVREVLANQYWKLKYPNNEKFNNQSEKRILLPRFVFTFLLIGLVFLINVFIRHKNVFNWIAIGILIFQIIVLSIDLKQSGVLISFFI